MALATKKEFAAMCGDSTRILSVYLKRGKVIYCNPDQELFDTTDKNNVAYINKRRQSNFVRSERQRLLLEKQFSEVPSINLLAGIYKNFSVSVFNHFAITMENIVTTFNNSSVDEHRKLPRKALDEVRSILEDRFNEASKTANNDIERLIKSYIELI